MQPERTTTLPTDLSRSGYSREEEYFYRLNRDLIDQQRHPTLSHRTLPLLVDMRPASARHETKTVAAILKRLFTPPEKEPELW